MLYTGIEKVLVQGIGFAQGVVLARLLKPEDFGLAAMLGIFLGVGTALAESGLGMAYVVYGRNSRRVFWWNVGIGAAIYAVLAALAPFIAAFYGEPVLKPLLWVMGLGMVLNAASVLGSARLQRERRFGALSSVNVVTTLAAFLAAVALALCGWGVWAIAWTGVIGAVLRLAALAATRSLGFAPGDGGDFRKMLGYGLKLTLSGLIHTIYTNAYNLVVGKMFSPAAVGLFARAQRWAALPADAVNESVNRVALPDMAQGRRGAGSYLLLNVLLLWLLLAALWLFADAIIGLVLGPSWLECVPYIRILIVGVSFTPVASMSLQYVRAKGRSDLVLVADAIRRPVQLGLLVTGACLVASGGCGNGVALLCWTKVAGDAVDVVAALFVAMRLWRERRGLRNEPVDLVYCWCNGKAFEDLERCRFSNNGELCHSIRSVDKFAPWFRTIWVFVNDGTEIPGWLSSHPKVRVVRHSEVIPARHLPLYNAVSIEFWLWAIPGLSERFVYANDDMFIGRRLDPGFFFTCDGRAVCRYERRPVPLSGTYGAQMKLNREFMLKHSAGLSDEWRKALRLNPHHNMDACRRSAMEDFARRFPEELERAGKAKFRTADQLQRDVFSLWSMATGKGVFRLKVGLLPPFRKSLAFGLEDTWCYRLLERYRPYLFCLNDTENATDDHRRIAMEWLKGKYGE